MSSNDPIAADVLATWLLLHGVEEGRADDLAEALLEWFNITPRNDGEVSGDA
jgi:hypothetical protein